MTDPLVIFTRELSRDDLRAIRSLLDVAFDGDFSDEDWEHTLGGRHVVLEKGGTIVSHAAVIERRLIAGDRSLRTGYVEAVATDHDHRRQGCATAVMRAVNLVISSSFEIGALSTEVPELYLSVGWERWHGPTYMSTPGGRVRTEEEDEGIMVLRTGRTAHLASSESLTCDHRSGDAW